MRDAVDGTAPRSNQMFRSICRADLADVPWLRRGTFKREAMMAVCVEREPRCLQAIWKVAEEHRGREENIC